MHKIPIETLVKLDARLKDAVDHMNKHGWHKIPATITVGGQTFETFALGVEYPLPSDPTITASIPMLILLTEELMTLVKPSNVRDEDSAGQIYTNLSTGKEQQIH